MKSFALEFGTNLFGKLKPDIKKRLQAVIDNPCQETWDDAYSIILNFEGRVITLWQAVIKIDSNMPKSKPMDSKWNYIPSKEIIKKAIHTAIFENKNQMN